MKNTQFRILVVVALVVASAVAMRVLPHPPNFAPIGALALLSGALMPRRWALTIPLLTMVISDAIIGTHDTMAFTWGSFMLIALLAGGVFRNNNIRVNTVIGASLMASVLFFVITNFGVWLVGGLYPATIDGLVACYVNAIPFFRNTLMGDLFFSGVFFGSYATAKALVRSSQLQTDVK